jgi:hypothetical protein
MIHFASIDVRLVYVRLLSCRGKKETLKLQKITYKIITLTTS